MTDPAAQLPALQAYWPPCTPMWWSSAPTWPDSSAAELDSLSVEHIARRWLWSRAPRNLFGAAARMIFGAELSDVSLLYFLSYLQAGGGFEELIETKHGAQESKFVGGAQGLSLAIARELGSRVETDSPVRAICQDDSGVSVVTDRQSYRARFAVLAIPPALRAHRPRAHRRHRERPRAPGLPRRGPGVRGASERRAARSQLASCRELFPGPGRGAGAAGRSARKLSPG